MPPDLPRITPLFSERDKALLSSRIASSGRGTSGRSCSPTVSGPSSRPTSAGAAGTEPGLLHALPSQSQVVVRGDRGAGDDELSGVGVQRVFRGHWDRPKSAYGFDRERFVTPLLSDAELRRTGFDQQSHLAGHLSQHSGMTHPAGAQDRHLGAPAAHVPLSKDQAEEGALTAELRGQIMRQLSKVAYLADAHRHKPLSSEAHLDISRKNLSQVPVEAWLLAPPLHTLNASRNGLVQLPELLARWAPLQRLRLDHNQLVALPEGLAHCRRLIELNVSGNRLRHLPQAFATLTSLTTLLANHNLFAVVPPQIGSCSAISKLWMRECQLGHVEGPGGASFPSGPDAPRMSPAHCFGTAATAGSGNLLVVGQLTNLTSLSLLHNEGLLYLPIALGRCTKLELLEVDDRITFPGPEIRGRGLADTKRFLHYILAGAEGAGEVHLDAQHLMALFAPCTNPPTPSPLSEAHCPPASAQRDATGIVTDATISGERGPESHGESSGDRPRGDGGRQHSSLMTAPAHGTRVGIRTNVAVGDVGLLQTFGVSLCQLDTAVLVSIAHHQIRMLPAQVGQLTQVTKLDVSFNSIHALPDTFGDLACLTHANLRFALALFCFTVASSNYFDFLCTIRTVITSLPVTTTFRIKCGIEADTCVLF